MIKKFVATFTLICAATAAQAQPSSPLVDKPICTRAELEASTAAYVKAQASGDISQLDLAENAQFLENMSMIDKADGLWNTSLPIAYSMSLHDSTRCKTFTEVIVTEGDHSYVLGTRLYMNEGKVIRIDSLVTDKGDWLYNANAYLKYASREDWTALHPYQRTPAQDMIDGANAYLDAFSDKFTQPPWGVPCERLEGGAYTNRDGKADSSCEVGIPNGILYIVNRDYLVDEEKGVINIFCRFGNSTSGMPDVHSFRYVNGKFRYVHTLSVNAAGNSPQADDNGAMAAAAN